jgi:CRISPR-associated protein Cas8b1/Cst1 subtype I-B
MAKPRPTTYKDWLVPEKLLVIRNWKRHGLTDEEVANNIGVARQTLSRWSKDYKDIHDALKTGKEEAVALIENKLFLKAMSGNLTAIIFWLKNNARDMYNDSQLSPDEIKQVKARTRKMLADARISEVKAKLAEQMSDTSSEKLDEILDKLVSETEDDDAAEKPDDE